ncbi:hypothetical protein QM012_005144 [Aureobasidium pullulans]|uniref:LPXTG-domain-containing protein n=1 Tax=Aureobasidium pullulans TaxID=5580 RepID=A0ABR0T5M7_AURPU
MTSTTAGPMSTQTKPMSGVFTPPPSCSTHWTYEDQSANSVTGGLLLQNAWAGQGFISCYPAGFDGWGRAPSFIEVFSPGACPTGYTTANNYYDGATTTAVCCLSKFGYTNFISSVNAGDKTAQFYGCTSIFTNDGPTTVFASSGTNVITSSLDGSTAIFTVVSGLITMWAQPITVAFQSSDLSLFTTSSPSISSALSATISKSTSTSSSTSSSSSSGSSSTITSSGTVATTSPAATKVPSSGPSDGVIAGIVIGAMAAIALIASAIFLFRRQRRASPSAENLVPMETQKIQSDYTATDPADYKHYGPSWVAPSDKKWPAGMRDREPVELADLRSSRRHELE